jgi:hypothetical protein
MTERYCAVDLPRRVYLRGAGMMQNRMAAVCLNVAAFLGIGAILSACDQDQSSTDGAAHVAVPDAAAPSGAGSLTLFWDAPTDNTDGSSLNNLKGYKLYYGEKSGTYTSVLDIANPSLTTYVVQNLQPGTYYFALADYNSQGVESALTHEISAVVD